MDYMNDIYIEKNNSVNYTNVKVKNRTMKFIIYIVLFFLYIYSPPFKFLPFGPIKLVALYSYIGLLTFFAKDSIKIYKQKIIFFIIVIYLVSLLYSIIIDVMSTNIYSESYNNLLFFVEILPISIFLSIYARKYFNATFEDILSIIVIVGVIQSIIAISEFIFPEMKRIIMENILKYTEIDAKITRPDLYFRGFGFSSGYLFSFPISQGILFMAALILSFKKRYIYLLSTPFILFTIGVNARIGYSIILIFLVIVFFILFSEILVIRFNKKIFLSILILFLITFLSYRISFIILKSSLLDKIIEWNYKEYLDFLDIISGKASSGTLNVLLKYHLFFPKGLFGMLFGEAKYIFGPDLTIHHSDIGYIRLLFYGGIFYSLLKYGSFACLFFKSIILRKKEKYTVVFLSSIFTGMMIVQFKGNIFSSNPAFRLVFFIFIFSLVEKKIKPSFKNTKNY
jgi:hypothetical protein